MWPEKDFSKRERRGWRPASVLGSPLNPPAVAHAEPLGKAISYQFSSVLAQRAGLSESHLSRLFKQQTGSSLVDYRNRHRLERFLRLYGGGQRKTMRDAALEAGFGSDPQFHRVFCRQMGYSPATHRRALT